MLIRYLESLSLQPVTFPSWIFSQPSPPKVYIIPGVTTNKVYVFTFTPITKYEQAEIVSESCFVRDTHREGFGLEEPLRKAFLLSYPSSIQHSQLDHILLDSGSAFPFLPGLQTS